MGGRPNPLAAARLANRTQQEQGNSLAHESERYVECATDTTLRRYLCRETCTCGSGRAFLRYLITLLLLAAGAPLLTIAHFFWNHFFRKDQFDIFLPNPSIIKYGWYHFYVFRFFRTI
ncbi:hypothetical protein IEQ34_025472 [Dendrobium chrysotoxum]|uniref:Uncharacterized protein n=1 Tax=Dendrobium chrysotoxum TaxID=161865 RepID=A0AAV7FQ70_DENCH|nr:hypothetical protein IEQ34_025472 [Dendrobium chrysotoxum]